jgi:hypothetical protein
MELKPQELVDAGPKILKKFQVILKHSVAKLL